MLDAKLRLAAVGALLAASTTMSARPRKSQLPTSRGASRPWPAARSRSSRRPCKLAKLGYRPRVSSDERVPPVLEWYWAHECKAPAE
jgi:hypothetical protein